MDSIEYGKTENLFNRDPATHKLIVGDLRCAEFGQIKHWLVTEKIDGTNMRVVYSPDEQRVEIRGRSDNAQIHGDLMKFMQDTFTLEKMNAQFYDFMEGDGRENSSVTIYGEGYGPGIQKGGGDYAPAKVFRMFDVMYHWRGMGYEGNGLDSWAMWETVQMIAEGLNVETVPVLMRNVGLDEVVDLVMSELTSETALLDNMRPDVIAEGVIARTDPYLFNHRGSPIKFKLKGKDIEGLA